MREPNTLQDRLSRLRIEIVNAYMEQREDDYHAACREAVILLRAMGVQENSTKEKLRAISKTMPRDARGHFIKSGDENERSNQAS